MGKRKQAQPKKLVAAKKCNTTATATVQHKFTKESGSCFSSVQTQGLRDYMEDYVAISHRKNRTSFFAVYDGHGGANCAAYCKENLFKNVKSHACFCTDLEKSLLDSFVEIHREYAEICQRSNILDGSTATVVCVQDEVLYHANVGDSRCIIVSKDSKVKELTRDHNGDLKDEHKRIKAESGKMIYDRESKCFRVNGVLAITRAIGDIYLPCVTAVPEVGKHNITEDDAFLFLASDGVWDVLSNEEVAKILMETGVQDAPKVVVELALAKGSDDNISAVAVDLRLMVPSLEEASEEKDGS